MGETTPPSAEPAVTAEVLEATPEAVEVMAPPEEAPLPMEPPTQSVRSMEAPPSHKAKERNADRAKQRAEFAKEFARRWLKQFPEIEDGSDRAVIARRVRRTLSSSQWKSGAFGADRLISSRQVESLSDDDLLDLYELARPKMVDALARTAAQSIVASMGAPMSLRPLASGLVDAAGLADAVAGVAFPTAFQALNTPHPRVAMCTNYVQAWTPVGYTRGELIGSLSLAPGERLTVEIHSWDKTTTHSESEIALESEVRSSEKHTQRDSLTVVQEYASNNNTEVKAGGTIPIPKFPISLGVENTSEAKSRMQKTAEDIRDDVVEASSVLKINRKLKIESSRDIGREEKQIRVIENTNRCHTLNCHYFEIYANYMVRTAPSSVQPCVLIRYPRIRFTADAVLCHEGTLRQSLLDRVFLAGFAAARALRIFQEEEAVEAHRRAERLDLTGAQLGPHAQVIADAYGALRGAVAAMDAAIEDYGYGNEWVVRSKLTALQIEHIWTWFRLPQTFRLAFDRFADDIASGRNPAEAIRALLAVVPAAVPPRAYSPAYDELNNRLGSFEPEAPSDAEIPDPVGWRNLTPIEDIDDAGLRIAMRDASLALRTLPVVDFAEIAAPAAVDVAEATVDFQRLACHLEANWMHYNQAIWAKESFEQRIDRLNAVGLSAVVENRIIGFQGQDVAFPLADLTAVPEVELQKLVADLETDIANFQSVPVLISVPSSGQVLEATVGECDACEDYVHRSRKIDLRLQGASARQAEAEADRLEARLQSNLFDDPSSPQTPAITVNLRTVPPDSNG
ncbi:hypothetical protein [Microbacterium oryzae]|uniref:hypothetical protein n=1 Tax=Microbacterium oryzae TaxID=743009 RepID=UPI0012E1B237|nr:hypothetical protein [Microbacterium oryzae]